MKDNSHFSAAYEWIRILRNDDYVWKHMQMKNYLYQICLATGLLKASNKNWIFLAFPEASLGRNNLYKLWELIYSSALPPAI